MPHVDFPDGIGTSAGVEGREVEIAGPDVKDVVFDLGDAEEGEVAAEGVNQDGLRGLRGIEEVQVWRGEDREEELAVWADSEVFDPRGFGELVEGANGEWEAGGGGHDDS